MTTQEITAADPDRRLTVHVGPGTVSARMPTPEECASLGISPDEPVLLVRRPNGRELLYPGELVTLAVDEPSEPPSADAVSDAVRSVLKHITEDLDCVLADLGFLYGAVGESPEQIIELAAELGQRRHDEFFCEQPCQFLTSADIAAGDGSPPRMAP